MIERKRVEEKYKKKKDQKDHYWKNFWKDKYKQKSVKRTIKSMNEMDKYKYFAYPNYDINHIPKMVENHMRQVLPSEQ